MYTHNRRTQKSQRARNICVSRTLRLHALRASFASGKLSCVYVCMCVLMGTYEVLYPRQLRDRLLYGHFEVSRFKVERILPAAYLGRRI